MILQVAMSQAQEGNWEPALALLRRANEPDEAALRGLGFLLKGSIRVLYRGLRGFRVWGFGVRV